ncbi:MAG: DUF5103 domain-containing protein [Muribaculaceae bacterium]
MFGAMPACAFTDTRQGTYDDRVRSLQVYPERDTSAPPVITLGSGDKIVVKFDILSTDRDYLRYELIHCNADWQPSGLVDTEFLSGFNQGSIDDYAFSQLTTTHYVNYRLTIPNDEISPTLSGNYLLRIYPEDDPDKTLAQARLMVSEQSAGIDADVTTRTDVDYNSAHQQLSVRIDTERAGVDDPFNDLKVMIQQNGRYDNEVALSKPLRMQGRNISIYEHLSPLIFEAGNEYRRFETVSVHYPGMGVAEIEYHDPYYHFTLYTDEPRNELPYSYDQTQHGRFLVREYNSAQSDIEADYVVVHFSLDAPELPGSMIFIDGDMVNRRFDPESLMVYNRATSRYERTMLLKQGAYNYQYLVVPAAANRGSTAGIEGNDYRTVNEYTIKVYTRRPTDRYDRLIGVSRISTE